MATKIIISLKDQEEAAFKNALQYQDGVTPEAFEDIALEHIRKNFLDPIMKGYVYKEEVEKIESIITLKQQEVEYVKSISKKQG